jgi:hypothetical membrane protein
LLFLAGIPVTASVSPPRQRPAPSRARPLARLTLAGIAVYVAIDVLLAFLRPGYSLIYNAESDYGRGPWFWVMDINFLLRCALSLAIAAALYRVARLDGRTRGGLTLLVAWAICSGLLAFFADDPEGTPQHGSGIVHVILAIIAFTCITIGTILVSASLISDPAWRSSAPVLLAISIAGAVAYLLLGTGSAGSARSTSVGSPPANLRHTSLSLRVAVTWCPSCRFACGA